MRVKVLRITDSTRTETPFAKPPADQLFHEFFSRTNPTKPSVPSGHVLAEFISADTDQCFALVLPYTSSKSLTVGLWYWLNLDVTKDSQE